MDGDQIYTAVDTRPKTTTHLRRLRNILANPRVAVLADHYEADWGRLWWVRADGIATVGGQRTGGAARPAGARYPQYHTTPPGGR